MRETVRHIGYTDAESGFDCNTCAVITAIDEQSPDIAQGVDAPTSRATTPPTRTSSTWPAPATRA